MSTVRYANTGDDGTREMGSVRELVSTCIAASTIDDDGAETVAPERIGERRLERSVAFAWRAEIERWIADQVAQGFTLDHGPTQYATFYHGPTDSPSNAWSARVYKVLT